MYTVGITDCDHAAMAEETRVFEENAIRMELHQCRSEADVIAAMQDYEVIGNQYAPLTERVFAGLPQLRVVVRYGVGVDHIDLEAARRHGVAVCNVPDYGMQEVAAHAVTMMLALCRKLIPMNQSVRDGYWQYERSIPITRLSEMTVGIIGLGRIGSCVANMIRNFNCRIVACDPQYAGGGAPDFVQMMELEALLRCSDVVTIHAPLESARNLITARELGWMKTSAYLINVSRGGIVNEDDLLAALKEGRIAGAACDVLLREPPASVPPLCQFENFICTPHMAWYSQQASRDLKQKLAEEMVRAVKGEPLRYQLN